MNAKLKKTDPAALLGGLDDSPATEETKAVSPPAVAGKHKSSYARAGSNQANATVYIARPALKRLKMISLEQDRPMNGILREALDDWLQKNGHGSLDEIES